MKSTTLSILGVACTVQAASITTRQSGTYQAMQNPATQMCITQGAYDSTTGTYSLYLGSCASGYTSFEWMQGTTGYLQSMGGLCVTSLAAGPIAGSPVALMPCSGGAAQKWTNVATSNLWQNGQGACLAVGNNNALVIDLCNGGTTDAFVFVNPPAPTTTTQTVTPTPTPTPVTYVSCSQWVGLTAASCPNGYQLNTNSICSSNMSDCFTRCCTQIVPPAQQTCAAWSAVGNSCPTPLSYTASSFQSCNADGSNCVQQCCSYVPPPPATQLCGSWSVQNGGPQASCGSNMAYTASDSQTCNADGSNCVQSCCSPIATQLCGAWSVQNGGPVNACNGGVFTDSDTATCSITGSDCQQLCCQTVF